MYDLLTAQEIRKRFRCVFGKDVSLQAIHYVAKKIGYKQKHIGSKNGYHKSVYTALTQHFRELLEYDATMCNKPQEKPRKQPILGDYYAYNGERDNVDYEWEKNEGKKQKNLIRLTEEDLYRIVKESVEMVLNGL